MVRTIKCTGGIAEHGEEIRQALLDDGFVYLLDYGITPKSVDEAFAESDRFFARPLDEKQKFLRNDVDNSGYVQAGMEQFDRSFRTEVREAFNINSPNNKFPDDRMREKLLSFGNQCWKCSQEILSVLAPILEIQPEKLVAWHEPPFAGYFCTTTMRLLNYPAFAIDNDDGTTTRCGAHTDYGSITLLWQDDVGGLELKTPEGFQAIEPVANAVLVNTGGTLEIWSHGKIRAGEHRVAWRERARRSIAYFVHPTEDIPVMPVPFEDEEVTLTSKQYTAMRFASTYN